MRKVALSIVVIACGMGLFGHPARAQEATVPQELLESVMTYRFYWMHDSTAFIACQVYERSGQPAGFPDGLSAVARRLLDRQVDPCPARDLRPARVAIHSATVGDSVAHVTLLVLNGEMRHTEEYVVRGDPTGAAWQVLEVKLSNHMYFVLPPAQRTPPPQR